MNKSVLRWAWLAVFLLSAAIANKIEEHHLWGLGNVLAAVVCAWFSVQAFKEPEHRPEQLDFLENRRA